MSRAKKITKQMLEDWGITGVHIDPDTQIPYITRLWYPAGKTGKYRTDSEKRLIRIDAKDATRLHPHSKDMKYKKFSFSYNGKVINITAFRLIYAWFYSEILDSEWIYNDNGNLIKDNSNNCQEYREYDGNQYKQHITRDDR